MDLLTPIKTLRTTVRPFEPRDIEGYLAFMTDPVATRYLMFTEDQKTREGARELFDAIVASYATEDPIYALAIADQSGAFVGSCGVSPLLPAEGIYECYYSLSPARWGQGYATEAMRALIARVFEDVTVNEIRAYMSPQNPASAAVAERLGMTALGIRQHPVFQNEGLAYSLRRSA